MRRLLVSPPSPLVSWCGVPWRSRRRRRSRCRSTTVLVRGAAVDAAVNAAVERSRSAMPGQARLGAAVGGPCRRAAMARLGAAAPGMCAAYSSSTCSTSSPPLLRLVWSLACRASWRYGHAVMLLLFCSCCCAAHAVHAIMLASYSCVFIYASLA
jgi:hypothetical protein